MTFDRTQGSSTFRRIQIAEEGYQDKPSTVDGVAGTHRGVPVDSSASYHALVNGSLTVSPEVEYLIPEEVRGSLFERHSVTPAQRQTSLSFSGPADFEQVVDFLKMGVAGDVAPVEDNAAYLWVFKPKSGRPNEPSSFSVIYGDNVRNFRAGYVMASQISLSGTMGEAVQLSVDMFAQDLTDNVALRFDSGTLQKRERSDGEWSNVDPDAEPWVYQAPYTNIQNMVALRTEFFIADTLEELLDNNARRKGYLRSWELTMPTGLHSFSTADGDDSDDLDYSIHAVGVRTAELVLSFVSQEETWDSEFKAWLNERGRWVRIVVHGPNINEGNDRFFDIMAFIRYDDTPELFADDDGKSMVSFTSHTYDPHRDSRSGWPEPGIIVDNTGTWRLRMTITLIL